MIWEHGESTLDNFVTRLNNHHPSIKFTVEKSTSQISFLDTAITVREGMIETSVYSKPTDRHTYLDYTSYHPRHIKESVVFSQFLRYRRICSLPKVFHQQAIALTEHFLNCNYPYRLINKIYAKVTNIHRSRLLQYKPHKESERIPLVVTHNEQIGSFLSSVSRDWDILQLEEELRQVFPQPPVIARRQPKSLRGMLIRSTLNANTRRHHGNEKCGKSRCKVCDHMVTDEEIVVPPTNRSLKPGPYNCDSSNVIYLLLCTLCPNIQYVGQASTSFRLRFNNHKSTIRIKKTGFPVSDHFNLPGHTLSCLKFAIIHADITDLNKRLLSESELIVKLGTNVHGLNRDMGFLSDFEFYRK